MDRAALLRLVTAGLAAPSAENRHALRFEAHAEGVDLMATDTEGWREQPHKAWLARMAAGAVAENLLLAAATQGQDAELRWLPDAQQPAHLARLHWRNGPVRRDPLAAQIPHRHTNRRFYQRQPLSADVLGSLSAAVAPLPGLRIVWLDTGLLRRAALSAMTLAEGERFRRRRLHEEMFEGIRFEQGWQGSVECGLPPAALEIEPPMRAGFALLRHWPLMRGLAAIGAHRLLAQRAARLPCALSPHLGLLVSDGKPGSVATLQAGRALQRAWLAATAASAAFHPMAAATALALQRPGQGWVDANSQRRLHQRLQALMAHAGLPDAQPVMFFRLGRAAPPSVVSGRTAAQAHLVILERGWQHAA